MKFTAGGGGQEEGPPGTGALTGGDSRGEGVGADSSVSWGYGKARREWQRYSQPPLFELGLAQFNQEAIHIYTWAAGFQMATCEEGKGQAESQIIH